VQRTPVSLLSGFVQPPDYRVKLARRGCLVDLLRALRRRAAAGIEIGFAVLKLKVISIRVILEKVDLVLGVASVDITSNLYTLIRVITLAGDRERLIHVSAICILIRFLAALRYSW
jgi:hypothetical protein